jgi:hypothetical protein
MVVVRLMNSCRLQHQNVVVLCNKASEVTVGQNITPLWQESRYGRISASKVHINQCKIASNSSAPTYWNKQAS